MTNQGTVVHLPTGGVINDPTKIVTTTNNPTKTTTPGTTTTDPTKTVTNQGTVVHLPTGGVINDPTKIVTTTNNPTKTTTPGTTTTDPTKTVTNQGTVVHLPAGGVINDPSKTVTSTNTGGSGQDGDIADVDRASAHHRNRQDCHHDQYREQQIAGHHVGGKCQSSANGRDSHSYDQHIRIHRR